MAFEMSWFAGKPDGWQPSNRRERCKPFRSVGMRCCGRLQFETTHLDDFKPRIKKYSETKFEIRLFGEPILNNTPKYQGLNPAEPFGRLAAPRTGKRAGLFSD